MPKVNVVIPEFSDAELVDRQSTIADPLGLPNVMDVSPAEGATLTFVGQYETDRSIRCALGHRHKRGYVFVGEEGQHYLIGHVCGRNDFGMGTWQDFGKGLQRLDDRVSYLRRVRDLDEAFRVSREWFSSLPLHPVTLWLDATQAALAERTRLFAAIRGLVEKGTPTLFVHGEERDFAAEERERERAAEQGRPLTNVPRIMRKVAKPVGVLQGGTLFTKRRSFARDLTRASALMGAFLDRGTGDLSTVALQNLTKVGRDILAAAEDLKGAASGAAAFFAPANLENFAAWANARRFDTTRWVAHGTTLDGMEGEDRVAVRLTPPTASFEFQEFDRLAERAEGWTARVKAAEARNRPRGRRRD